MTIKTIEAELNLKIPAQSITDTWSFGEDSKVTFDKNVLLATIYNRANSFCVLYPDPDYFKMMSDNWWSKWKDNFYKWFEVMQAEYNPIENYDRQEKWHDDITDDNEVNQTGTVKTGGTNTSETTKSSYDSSSYQPLQKVTDTLDTTDTRNLKDTVDNDRDIDHEGRIHGNIGTMTTQDMATQELNLRYNNVYNMISDCFVKDLLIAVY